MAKRMYFSLKVALTIFLLLHQNKRKSLENIQLIRRAAWHRGRICASHPAASGLILGITKGLFLKKLPRFIDGTALLRQWTVDSAEA